MCGDKKRKMRRGRGVCVDAKGQTTCVCVCVDVLIVCVQTPLHWASSNGHKEVAALLVSSNANIEAKDVCLYIHTHTHTHGCVW